jgi:phosphoenolpyruvate carboxykinase (ATP)
LVNTGWFGGSYGVGERISIKHTRAIVSAALNGELRDVSYKPHPIFQILVPETVPGVPQEILDPQNTWDDPEAYERQARDLAMRFVVNFQQFSDARPEIVAAGPIVD